MARNGNRLLVLRFSALGDILLAVPVVDALARKYPHLEIVFVSRPAVGSIFSLLPSNVHFIGLEPHGKNIFRIFSELAAFKPSAVCDLHCVLRTIALGLLFSLHGVKVCSLHKDRAGSRHFLKTRPVIQRISVVERYAEVFGRLGYPVEVAQDRNFLPAIRTAVQPVVQSAVRDGIGIAPFAAHKGKIYPLELMEQVVACLGRCHKVYLFGAGPAEDALLSSWERRYGQDGNGPSSDAAPGNVVNRTAVRAGNVVNMTGRLGSLEAELCFMAGLKLMLTMDSANMHLASLAGTRVLSIWGATHPLGGFLGVGQHLDDCLMADLPCRPCSIYGSKPCRLGNYPCLSGLSPSFICKKVEDAL